MTFEQDTLVIPEYSPPEHEEDEVGVKLAKRYLFRAFYGLNELCPNNENHPTSCLLGIRRRRAGAIPKAKTGFLKPPKKPRRAPPRGTTKH